MAAACRYLRLWRSNPKPGHLLARRASNTPPFQRPRHTADGERMACRGANSDEGAAKAHFVFVPLMHHGHLIPAVDAALQLAAHGALASVVVTPSYTARLRSAVQSSGLPVRLVELPLDLAGTDDVDRIPLDQEAAYLLAASRLRAPLERHLRAHAPPVTCVVSDICHPWTAGLAASLGVPRLNFLGMSAYCLLCLQTEHHAVAMHNAYAAMDPYSHLIIFFSEKNVCPSTVRVPSHSHIDLVDR